jgi:hypothetical protein
VTLPFLNRVSKENKIIGLDRLITDNPAEMIQVIDWLLIGGVRLTQRGRFMSDEEMPLAVRDLAFSQRLVSDPVAAWIFDATPQVDQGAWTSKQAIYDSFCRHAEDAGRKPVAANAFWLRIAEHFRGQNLDTTGEQMQVDGKRVRHVQLLIPEIKPTKHAFVPSAAQVEEARKNPPETIHGTNLPDMPEAFQ